MKNKGYAKFGGGGGGKKQCALGEMCKFRFCDLSWHSVSIYSDPTARATTKFCEI